MATDCVVRFREPLTGEEALRFVVREVREDRVLVALLGWEGPIAPTFVYSVNELTLSEG